MSCKVRFYITVIEPGAATGSLTLVFSQKRVQRNLPRLYKTHVIFDMTVIEPVAAQARLIICTENGFSLPKVFADFTLEEIEILLSRQQVCFLCSISISQKMYFCKTVLSLFTSLNSNSLIITCLKYCKQILHVFIKECFFLESIESNHKYNIEMN